MRQVDHTLLVKLGWNKFVAAHKAEAKEEFKAWVLEGRPREGPVLDLKTITKAKYIYAVCYVCKHEQVM